MYAPLRRAASLAARPLRAAAAAAARRGYYAQKMSEPLPASGLVGDDAYEPPAKPPREARVPDLRSDTVTKPTAEMLCAILDAPVGDDVYGDDPTVNRLQREAAELLQKEAALFVPSGTMSNLLAIAAQCGRGEEVICGDEQHIVCYEQAGASQLFGVAYHTLPQEDDGTFALTPGAGAGAGGKLRAARCLEYAIGQRHGGHDAHYARPALVAIEQTHNRCGGVVLPQAWVDECAAVAHAAGLRLHMDGARLFNAAAAAGVPAHRIVRDCDTVSICLSKGLGAPVGSLLVGDAATIERARR
jgi:threonine aldolase